MIGPGDRVGGYLIRRKLGEGSIGVVFEAVHQIIGRRAAIKVLREDLWSRPGLGARFVATARAVSRVRHPGVVCLLDFDQLPGGGAYIAMEYVDGQSLAQYLTESRGPLALSVALRIASQLAQALEVAAHYAVPHGALRPDRIRFDTESTVSVPPPVKILDLEVSRFLAGTTPSVSRTPYTAPEMLLNRSAGADRADVYALGVILYEMLAGVSPYTGNQPGDHRAQPTLAPPRPILELRVSTPEPVAELLDQMLAVDPSARPEMRQVMYALAGWDVHQETRLELSAAGRSDYSEAQHPRSSVIEERRSPATYPLPVEVEPSAPVIRAACQSSPRAIPAAAPVAAAAPIPASSIRTGQTESTRGRLDREPSRASQLVEQALAQLDVGCFGLDAPRQMAVAAAVMVTASAVRDRLLRQLISDGAEHGAPQVADTRLGQLVRVELLPDVPAEFTVTPLSDPEQPVLRSELTQWQWLVTPHLAGPRKRLRVRATNIVDVGGQRLTKSLPVRTLEVEVTVDAPAVLADEAIGTATVRRLLDEVLPSDAALEAFCLDYFPRVMLRFGGGMERLQKVTLLLSASSPQNVLERLRDAEPEQMESLLAALADPAAEPPAALPTATDDAKAALLTTSAGRSAGMDAPVPSRQAPRPPAPVSLPADAAPAIPPAAPGRILAFPAPPLPEPEPEPEPPPPAQVTARPRYLSRLLGPLLLLALGLGVYRCTAHCTSAPRSPTHLGPT